MFTANYSNKKQALLIPLPHILSPIIKSHNRNQHKLRRLLKPIKTVKQINPTAATTITIISM